MINISMPDELYMCCPFVTLLLFINIIPTFISSDSFMMCFGLTLRPLHRGDD